MERIEVLYPAGTLELEVTSKGAVAKDYIGFAARSNAKRAFLFMSKVCWRRPRIEPLEGVLPILN